MFNFIKVVIILFVTVSCGGKPESNVKLSDSRPEQIIEGFIMADRQAGEKLWGLSADSARIYERDEYVMLERPVIRFYEDNKETSIVSAKYGKLDQNINLLELWGDVVIDSLKDNAVIKTEKVFYDIEKKIMYSDEPVEIIRPGSITKGIGFESDAGLNIIEIKNNLTEIENVGKK